MTFALQTSAAPFAGKSDRGERRVAFWFAASLWLLYAVTSTGTLPADPSSRFDVADAVVKRGRIDVPANGVHTAEHNGRKYVVFFPGQSVLFLPAAAVGSAATRVAHLPAGVGDFLGRFLACTFWMPAFAVAAVLGHVWVLRLLGAGPRVAYFSGAMLAVATPLWVYATTGSEEVVLAAAAVWAAWGLLDARAIYLRDRITRETARRIADRFGLAAACLAAGMIHRGTFAAVVCGLAIPAILYLRQTWPAVRLALPRLIGWAVLAAFILALLPAYNFARFGSPFDTGYARYYAPLGGAYQTPLVRGLIGHLFSPGKSLFLYAPWLILLPISVCLKSVRGRLGATGVALAVMTALHLFIYSRFVFWGGDWCWGVRFHTSLLPLLCLPIGLALAHRQTIRARWFVGILGFVSIAIQVAGISLNWGLEHRQHPEDFADPMNQVPAAAAWTWRESPLRLRFVNLGLKLEGRPLPPAGDARSTAVLECWNVFPARAAAAGTPGVVRKALWGAWAVLLAAQVASLAALVRLASHRLPDGALASNL